MPIKAFSRNNHFRERSIHNSNAFQTWYASTCWYLRTSQAKISRNRETSGRKSFIAKKIFRLCSRTYQARSSPDGTRRRTSQAGTESSFGWSATSSSGVSLNGSLVVGPTVQEDLLPILIRFWIHKVVLSIESVNVYSQLALESCAKDFHRILWRDSPEEPINQNRMTKVTYGISSSASHSTRSLVEVANRCPHESLKHSNKQDFHDDDYLSGSASITDAHHKVEQNWQELKKYVFEQRLKKYGFEQSKWISRHREIIPFLPEALRENADQEKVMDERYKNKILGISWMWNKSICCFRTILNPETNLTKRYLRYLIASTHLLVLTIHNTIQNTSSESLATCNSLGRNASRWHPTAMAWHLDSFGNATHFHVEEMHRFSRKGWRSSTAAFHWRLGKCICCCHQCPNSRHRKFCLCQNYYRKTPGDANQNSVSATPGTFWSSSWVEPFNQDKRYINADICATTQTFGWTDTTSQLQWLEQLPRTWTTFVANSVSGVQQALQRSNWKHVASSNNPADCSSRGTTFEYLKSSSLWCNGPAWLQKPQEKWSKSQIQSVELFEIIDNKKTTDVSIHNNHPSLECSSTIHPHF